MLATLEQMTYLGPARVLAVSGNRAKVELPDEHAWAVLALGTPYEPAAEDEVLVLGGKNAWYVIGVIRGHGTTTLTAPGNLCIRAPHGAIELSAAQNVAVRSPEVTISAGILEVVAKSLFERFTGATRWVKETFQLRAGRIRTRVDGVYDLTADRIQEQAEKDVKIDGDKIYLG